MIGVVFADANTTPITCPRVLVQSQQGVQAVDQSLPPADLADRQEYAGHVGLAGGGVVAESQDLARAAEQHLLVGYQARQEDAEDTDAVQRSAAHVVER